MVILAQVHDAHALRVATNARDGLHVGANDHPTLRDQHGVILCSALTNRDDRPVAGGGADVDHALPAAALDRVVLKRGSLAVAVFTDGQEIGAFFCHDHPNDLVVTLELDATHSTCRAAHGARRLLVETNGATGRGGHQDRVAFAAQADANDGVPLFESDGLDATLLGT